MCVYLRNTSWLCSFSGLLFGDSVLTRTTFFPSSLHKVSLDQWNLRLDLSLDNCPSHGLLPKVPFSGPHDSVDWDVSVFFLNKSYRDKSFTHCSRSLTSRQQIQCVVKAAAVVFHSSSKWSETSIQIQLTLPVELHSAKQGHLKWHCSRIPGTEWIYVCTKLQWLQVLRSDGKMLVLSGLE